MDGRLSIKTLWAFGVFVLMHVSLCQASVPVDSDKILALKEKELLSSTVLSYLMAVHSYSEDNLRLKSDREWLNIKIQGIEDQKRSVPRTLRQAMQQIDQKMSHQRAEITRLNALTENHLAALRQLDDGVKRNNGNKGPDWWVIEGWLYRLMYPDQKPPMKKALQLTESNESTGVYPATSGLRQELEAKIKEIELDNWVALVDDVSGLALDVQLPILFGMGKSHVAKDYIPFFKKLAWLVKPYSTQVEVAGYSDGLSSKKQPLASRMALGASRAAKVMEELVETGLNPGAFKVVTMDDYGGNDPEKMNLSPAMKRRVDVRVLFQP